MKKAILFANCFALFLLLTSCNDTAKKADTPAVLVKSESTTDMTQLRADIQKEENKWADLQNKKDVNGLMALYADDAVSMQDGGPALKGIAAIKAKQEQDFAAPPKYATIAFETQDVYGTADEVTEVGKTTYKDAAGKETGGGKYMCVFQRKDGMYKCVREIYNKDTK